MALDGRRGMTMQTYQLFINGQWKDSDKSALGSVNPFTRRMGADPGASPKDVGDAVAAAKAAFPAWVARQRPGPRPKPITGWPDWLEANADRMAWAKPPTMAR